jgi:N-acetylglutamate synthase-like GNAT family acetyltransferase
MRLTTLAVHPAYWKHGHGTRLTNWCTRLADLDHVPIGVSAAKMGVRVFTKAGFQEEVRVQIKGYELPDESRDSFACNEKEPANVASIELWIGVRCPPRRRKLSWNLWRSWNCFKAEEEKL